jgi:hypothetical protein
MPKIVCTGSSHCGAREGEGIVHSLLNIATQVEYVVQVELFRRVGNNQAGLIPRGHFKGP